VDVGFFGVSAAERPSWINIGRLLCQAKDSGTPQGAQDGVPGLLSFGMLWTRDIDYAVVSGYSFKDPYGRAPDCQ